MSKEEITERALETTMVSTYMEIKKLFQTKEASEKSFDLEKSRLKEILEQIKRGKKSLMKQKEEWQNQTCVLL